MQIHRHIQSLFIRFESIFQLRHECCFFLLLVLLFGTYPHYVSAQANPNEVEWNGNSYSLKKVVSNLTVPSGVNFSYTILFSAPAGVSTISIQDIVPIPPLTIVSVTAAGPVLGVNPVITFNNTSGVVTYDLTSLPPTGPPMGSFTIVVKFPEGVTCNGDAARNRAGILIDGKWNWTPYVTTTATAVNPWKVTKSILSGAIVNPGGGSCGYLMKPGDTITYRLTVTKDNPYWCNVTGQQNMSSAVVSDVLPAGAILISSTCGATVSTPTITWNVNAPAQLLNAAVPCAWYYCDMKVYYPASSFPVGTQILNQATLTGVSCSQQASFNSNQTCIQVANIAPNPHATFQKYLAMTNRVPGCQGFYYIVFCNNGNVPLSAFHINDAIPSGIHVNHVQIYGASTTSTMNLIVNGSPFASGINAAYNSGTLTATVNSLQFQMTGTLPVGACLYMYVYFTVNPNPTGTIVNNCATFTPLANSLTLPQTCVQFTVEAGAPVPCLLKDICSPQASYVPGDIVRFRLRVQNIGSANLTGASVQDILHSNFTYVGNETYYQSNNYTLPCSSAGSPPAGASAWTGPAPAHSGNNLAWNLPLIASNCQLFYTAYCGAYGTAGIPYYYIEFDARVDSFALPGVTPNNFKISGGNLTASVTSNTVNVLVVASFGQEVSKFLSTDNGVNFTSSGTTTAGSTARFRLNYRNVSNIAVHDIKMIDLLALDASPADKLILNRTVSRGSQFDISYIGNHATSLLPGGTPPVPVLSWSPGEDICIPPYVVSGCLSATWGATPNTNHLMNFGSFALGPNKNLREDFDVGIPSTAPNQKKVCNDFAAGASASFLLNGNPTSVVLPPVASAPVCLVVGGTQSSCCDSVRVERVTGPGNNPCCAKITTTCKVKAVEVKIVNGTFISTAWNCGPLPSGFIGQSNFTFAPNGCILQMTNCVNPVNPGLVTITYMVYFENGQQCEKKIEFDCKPADIHCCDSVRVVPVSTGEKKCCARITTTCKVKAIDVTVINGTLSSVNWNCGSVPSGYNGQSSFTFAPNGCVLDMITCVNASQPVVTINFVIYFENGEKCEKKIELKCEPVTGNCCDSVRVVPVFGAAGEKLCCARITATCKVKAVDVTVTNGVLSSTSWNCGSLPTGYVGQSSYTFAPNGCILDMINCVKPNQPGLVVITYILYFENGEKCEKKIELDCSVSKCCETVKLTAVQGECCARLVTECKVKTIDVKILNGVIQTVSWNCGIVPPGYAGQANYTFNPGGCVVNMELCVKPLSTGSVVIQYGITFDNGEVCEKSIKLNCTAWSSCCAEVDFKLKTKWPNLKTQIGIFHITNLDPTVPICYIEITPSPAGSFTAGGLQVDGNSPTQPWTPVRIPATGNLLPAAINTLDFSLIATGYKGIIKICVFKCDGTFCCFEFNWNKLVIAEVETDIEKNQGLSGLVAVSISPVVKTPVGAKVRYISFGLSDEKEVAEGISQFFAISAAAPDGDDYPAKLALVSNAWMGKFNAFFELREAKAANENLGLFNLVFHKKLPKLGATLFDENGNILFSGVIKVSPNDTATSVIVIGNAGAQGKMFEFIDVYPNPSSGSFNLRFALGEPRDVEIRLVTSSGQTIWTQTSSEVPSGIHQVTVDSGKLSSGLYKVVLFSGGEFRSRSLVLKR